jgi:hypothetical protein
LTKEDDDETEEQEEDVVNERRVKSNPQAKSKQAPVD